MNMVSRLYFSIGFAYGLKYALEKIPSKLYDKDQIHDIEAKYNLTLQYFINLQGVGTASKVIEDVSNFIFSEFP